MEKLRYGDKGGKYEFTCSNHTYQTTRCSCLSLCCVIETMRKGHSVDKLACNMHFVTDFVLSFVQVNFLFTWS